MATKCHIYVELIIHKKLLLRNIPLKIYVGNKYDLNTHMYLRYKENSFYLTVKPTGHF